jgi:hypothetical protein
MKGYLGEAVVEQQTTKFKGHSKGERSMYFLESYGGIDGTHHKDWILDQIARVMKGTPIVIKLAKWSNGQQEFRISTGDPSKEYLDWVTEMKSGEDGPDTYGYEEGIAP